MIDYMIKSVLNQLGGKYTIVPHQFSPDYQDDNQIEEEIDTSSDVIDINLENDYSTNLDAYDIYRLDPDKENISVKIDKIYEDVHIYKVLGAIVDVTNNNSLSLTEIGVNLSEQDTLFVSLEKLNVGDRIIVGDKILINNYSKPITHIEQTNQSAWVDNVLVNCKVNDDIVDVTYIKGHTQYSVEKIDKQTIKNDIVIYLYNISEEELSDIRFREVIL